MPARRIYRLRVQQHVRPPYRLSRDAGGAGRRSCPVEDDVADAPLPLPSAPLTPIDRRQFDYSDIERCMAQMDELIRQTRRVLNALAGTVIQDRTADRLVDCVPRNSGRTEMARTP